ncbi:MAG: CpXC domain-containing protein [Acidaminococcaceae bacterium]|nr:CpXC domain-containing protein [Acidaminococcaceae bacterium]HBX75258.1 hypothetical protein [Acidaminococcaceae bacterium]
MSDVTKKMILCPHCHRTAYFNIWNSINTNTDPDTFEQVRNLSLFRFCCPYCGQTSTINYSFLYHQMDRSLFIYYVPEDEDIEPVEQILGTILNGKQQDKSPDSGAEQAGDAALLNALTNYRCRIVRTHKDFLEKLAILDAGLDDRLVELTKVMLGAQAERQLAEYGFRVKGASFLFNRETREMGLMYEDKNSSQTATVSFDQHVANVYNQLIDKYSSVLNGSHQKDTVIDWNWASGIFKETGSS